MEEKILGALYGMALGDAMGMPSELWSRRRVKEHFGSITTFLDGPRENEIAREYQAGQFTDDTAQALLLIQSLIATDGRPNIHHFVKKLLGWADEIHAFERNILGVSSKAALLAIREGKSLEEAGGAGETNGAAMRIAPIGCLIPSADLKRLVDAVEETCKATHYTDVAIAGASMIAAAVSAAIDGKSWDKLITIGKAAAHEGWQRGKETYAPSLIKRLDLALTIVKNGQDEEEILQNLYDVVGAGLHMAESVPTALALAYYARTPLRCSQLCANLGGDTDTIGAMATAICGAYTGIHGIDRSWIDQINSINQVDFAPLAQQLAVFRNAAQ